ncbi:MAG: hypothetical protein IAG10_21155 [Planctomycetaceae bacterium]|nr:hypothetical protein [Planctomycetaceae bacterium]
MTATNRRDLLKAGLSTALGATLPSWFVSTARGFAPAREKLPVAAVVTVYRKNSHADVIVGKILEGFQQDGGNGPDLRLVSLYTDQVPANELSLPLAEKHGFRLAKSIDEAITLGTDQVQVAGVISIGEHGDYPFTPDTKQHQYPRRRFFDEIVATFRRCGKAVPVFNDKHLSYRWEDARVMVETAKKMNFPFLAGSSVPVAWREPPLELPRDCEIEAALTIGYGGLESYGFHALEAHQCMIERRRGGETGVASVQTVSEEEIRKAESAGLWSSELFAAALRQLPGSPQDSDKWTSKNNSAVYLMQHRDGLKSAVVMANGLARHQAFAVKLKGRAEPLATWFQLQNGPPYGHFAYLVHAIEETIHSGRSVYPIERTLLTTGILDRVMQSLAQDGKRLETPELAVSYQSTDWPFANHPQSTLALPNE